MKNLSSGITYRIRFRKRLSKGMKVYAIDATRVARESQMGNRINTIMQTCFFALSGVLPRDEAIIKIKEFIRKSYGKRGEPVVRQNFAAVDAALAHLHEIPVPENASSTIELNSKISADAPDFVRNVTAEMIAGRGDQLPVSAFPEDGTYPVGTTQWEKRNIAQDVPVWEPDLCIECGKCVMVCPHSTIRAKVCSPGDLMMRRRDSNTCLRSGESFPISYTRFKSPWKTAPAAGSALKFVPQKTRAMCRGRRSTCSRSCRCVIVKELVGTLLEAPRSPQERIDCIQLR